MRKIFRFWLLLFFCLAIITLNSCGWDDLPNMAVGKRTLAVTVLIILIP